MFSCCSFSYLITLCVFKPLVFLCHQCLVWVCYFDSHVFRNGFIIIKRLICSIPCDHALHYGHCMWQNFGCSSNLKSDFEIQIWQYKLRNAYEFNFVYEPFFFVLLSVFTHLFIFHIVKPFVNVMYLFAQDQLMIKKEEDSLLTPAIRLIDPWHLTRVDQLWTSVQNVITLRKNKTKLNSQGRQTRIGSEYPKEAFINIY